MIDLLISLAIGALAGWIAGIIMKAKGGIIFNIILGVVGGAVGGFVLGLVGISFFGFLGTIIRAVAGACILIAVARLITK